MNEFPPKITFESEEWFLSHIFLFYLSFLISNLWPHHLQLSQDWLIHHPNMILFIFCVIFESRVESIGYLIKWQRNLKWKMTFKTLAKMDHWKNWKRKSIHPTSILEMGFDDQLIGLYFWYFRVKELLFILWFLLL